MIFPILKSFDLGFHLKNRKDVQNSFVNTRFHLQKRDQMKRTHFLSVLLLFLFSINVHGNEIKNVLGESLPVDSNIKFADLNDQDRIRTVQFLTSSGQRMAANYLGYVEYGSDSMKFWKTLKLPQVQASVKSVMSHYKSN